MSGVPETDLVNAARNYAEHCQRERKREQYIKNPENFIKDNMFIRFAEKGEEHGNVGRNAGTDEKSANQIMQERGFREDFEGF